jgi:hypothetical protein
MGNRNIFVYYALIKAPATQAQFTPKLQVVVLIEFFITVEILST